MISNIPKSATEIINIENLKQTGIPSSNLSKANYNKLLKLKGNAYELGYQLGYQTGHNIILSVRWSIMSLVIFTKSQNETSKLVHQSMTEEEINYFIDALVIINTWLYKNFYSKALPKIYQDEALGIIDGARALGNNDISIGHISVINFMHDIINCFVNVSFQSQHTLTTWIKSLIHNELKNELKYLPQNKQIAIHWFFEKFKSKDQYIGYTDFCDAYNTCDSNNDPETRYFTRFLQFPSVDYLFYDIMYPIIRIPTDGRRKSIGWTVAGLFGSYTMMNDFGVCVAMNYFRSEAVSPSDCGFNMLIILRMVTDYANNTDHAIQILKNVKRGSPYFIIVFDGEKIVVIELFGSSADLKHPVLYTSNLKIRHIIPTCDDVIKNSPPIENNLIIREPNYDIDRSLFIKVNHDLFEYSNIKIPIENIETGNIFTNWQQEQNSLKTLANKYFLMPIPLSRNLMVQTNNAVTVAGRCSQLGDKSNKLVQQSEAITWRFSTLSNIVEKHISGNIKDVMMIPFYVSPYLNPQYPSNDYYFKRNFESNKIPVQCSITIYNPYHKKIYIKSGPWSNPWICFGLE